MASNISYLLMQKTKSFETFSYDFYTVSIEHRKWLKKVGILRVKCEVDNYTPVNGQIDRKVERAIEIFCLQSCSLVIGILGRSRREKTLHIVLIFIKELPNINLAHTGPTLQCKKLQFGQKPNLYFCCYQNQKD